jgi:hypothetical protein
MRELVVQMQEVRLGRFPVICEPAGLANFHPLANLNGKREEK